MQHRVITSCLIFCLTCLVVPVKSQNSLPERYGNERGGKAKVAFNLARPNESS